ncbi:MAG: sigma-54-dependent Fis family transcriptional regulator [Hyphomonadaceae bacterium]|nr:sigma-54-dependent Fis family transcriptional regulator [Hyphomonadaceae bacterium]OUX93718.1 MAG: sigma-54-dependent Fis family transcriptional regulator [Hyphomonas sp. TMED17]CAI8286417.1 MAG: Nitrogen assimilation regulatory protein [Hyphomonas sp. TMED17]
MTGDILIVDDEPDIRELIAGVLEDEGFSTRTAATAEKALSEVGNRVPSLVVLDVWLQGSGMDGLTVLEYLKKMDPLMPIIVISGHGNIETAVAAIRRGAYDFIEKPFEASRLIHLIERAIESAKLKRENETLKTKTFETADWIGGSGVALALRQAIEKVAPTNSRVLVTGDAGVGKELCARLIHAKSKRAAGPFVLVSAANIAPDQMERELFGEEDENGIPVKLGMFEQAHTGSLLLDEVGEMPLGTQTKILRVLTEQRFQRVNGRSDVEVDVRVMSSSTRSLEDEVANERFRLDLYYRLNVVPVDVPSLSKRREDIPELVAYFASKIADSSGLNARPFSEEAIAVLQSLQWPGNVRQLRNLVERVLILSRGATSETVRAEELPLDRPSSTENDGLGVSTDLVSLSLRDAREQFERDYLKVQITRFDGNISRTAEFIGMERSALHRKLKALGIRSATGSTEA